MNYVGSHYFNQFEEKYNDEHRYYYAPLKKRVEQNISKIKITTIDGKGKKNEYIQQFNPKGKLIYSNNPSAKFEYKAEYLNDTLMTYSYSKDKKGNTNESKITYTNGKIKTYESFKNGKRELSESYTYSSSNKILTSLVIDKKNHKREMNFEYNEEDKLKKSTYFIDGKLKKVWNYECKPQGEIIVASKEEETSSRCQFRSENNDGSYSIFTRTIKKEIPYLSEMKYTADSVYYESNDYIKDTILKTKWEIDKQWHIITNYNKGKITFQYHTKYNENEKILESKTFRKNKCIFLIKNKYDKNGTLIEKSTYFKPQNLKPGSIQKFELDENGLVVKDERFGQKGKPYTTLYEYTKF